MGWDFCQDWKSIKDVVSDLKRGYERSGYKILAHGAARETGESCQWFALEDSKGARFASVCLVQKGGRNEGYGYKEVSEHMGPYYHKVPKAVWDAIKDSPAPGEYAQAWRDRVVARKEAA